jgi:hypothetical protein
MGKTPIKRLIDYAERSIKNRIQVFLVGLLGFALAVGVLQMAYGENVADEKFFALINNINALITPFNLILFAGILWFVVGYSAVIYTPIMRFTRAVPRNSLKSRRRNTKREEK